MSRILYARVSTAEQNLARQLTEDENYDRVFVEKISGKNMNRPQLKAMLEYVRKGDIVEAESYSRLARNTKDLLEIIDKLDEKGAAFISHKEKIDTSTPQGRLMMTIFAGLAQFEREQTLQRQAEGIAIAKAEGKYKGRQPIAVEEETFKLTYDAWKSGKLTATAAMKMLGLKPNTFYRRIKEYEGRA